MKRIKEKLIIYGANYLVRPFENFFEEGLDLGNPYGVVICATADIINIADKPLTHVLNNTVKVVGGSIYLLRTIENLVNFSKGDVLGIADLPFNVSMFYNSVKDLGFDLEKTIDIYKDTYQKFLNKK